MEFNQMNEVDKDFFLRFFNYYDNQIAPDQINVLKNEDYNDTNRISIYQTPFNSIIFTASTFYNQIKDKIKKNDFGKKISLYSLKNLIDNNKFKDGDQTVFLYLNPNNHLEINAPNNFNIRKLTKKDKKAFLKFKEECSQADLNEGQISFDDPIVVGCFSKDKLTAAASYWFWGKGLADIGVVVHPDFRKLGIGKATISKLAVYGHELNRINVYRHNKLNKASHNLALSLNFEKKMIIEPTRVLDI
ncbi:MAG TPA: GNAT family N-acetyltransferase [Halanaerobiales bacterium]|nr:GNAT family N-acetyltransferase [Halanaerobiales bacterium]